MLRIGIDVGGTNTDAVVMDDTQVVEWVKMNNSADITTGVTAALHQLLAQAQVATDAIGAVMIGTTQFTNAVVQRRDLAPVAAVRLCLPAAQSLPPMVDWPEDLRDAVGNCWFLAHGGYEFDGREISALDEAELRAIAARIRERGISAIAVSAVFSPINPEMEQRAAAILAEEIPAARITISEEIGRVGLLERENAAILNACLQPLGGRVIEAFSTALADAGITAPLFLTQNDGTLMAADYAKRFPVLTFASGPTNSMRGAAFLSDLQEALVVDIGGTTTDVGALHHGFPREAGVAIEVGGVRTNFRMPDVLSIGLGGGSLVQAGTALTVGPQSVGYRLVEEGLVFGGTTLTATDVAVAGGMAEIGDPTRVRDLDRDLVQRALSTIETMAETACDRMLLTPDPVPVLVVGGGSILVGERIGVLEATRPPYFQVANAVGAAIAQISGEVDRVYALSDVPREQALADARRQATERAVDAGAAAESVQIVEVEEVPLAYLPSNATRIRVKAVGDLAIG
ncbi:MAG TPA: hydantoinase/oxoprolinase family protein [Chloroflexota bacterium]|nr:hydantoinase/oxoprolinase family protein [Chloroflexota bacterium]